MRGQPGHNTRPFATQFPGFARMNDLILKVALIRKLQRSLMCVAYFVKMLSVCICTTRHYQTSGRLVEELNVGTVLPEIITDADDIFTGTPGINDMS